MGTFIRILVVTAAIAVSASAAGAETVVGSGNADNVIPLDTCCTTEIQTLIVDPFLLGVANPASIDLAQILPNINVPGITARGLVADNASAAIAVFRTPTRADVAFTVSNGTTLAPYAADFLTQPPAPGAAALTVPASQLIAASGAFYAAALVQAPAEGVEHSFSTPVTVAAQQGPHGAQSSLALVPPPVLLVHGIWGDLTSLQNIGAYLSATPPWQGLAAIVPICYSKYFAFDAPSDPLADDGDPCEATSESALTSGIASVEQALDLQHFVGGRVDIVAHSMGGLAARHYAAIADFQNLGLRYRNLGAFHELVTIDTPELGSSLATFLVNKASSKYAYRTLFRPYFFSPPHILWFQGGTKCNYQDTVETCFAKFGMPLTAPGFPLEQGAVYSLTPGSSSISLLPRQIPNAILAGISAVWPESDQTESLLRNEINTLIQAIYKPFEVAPTVDQLLGGISNDVVVTQPSQTYGLPPGHDFMASDLAHTFADEKGQRIVGGSNDNVLNSTAVSEAVACFLAKEGDASCAGPLAVGTRAAPPGASTSAESEVGAKFFAADRVTLGQVAGAVLGKPVRIPVRLSPQAVAAGVTRNLAFQDDNRGQVRGASSAAPIRHGDAQDYIEVTPQRLGRMKFTVETWFGDGALAISSVNAVVRPPDTPPLTFKADVLPVLGMVLGGAAEPVAHLHPAATYPGIDHPVPIDPEFLHYTLLPESGPIPVSIATNGVVHALRPGKAALEVRFGSVADRIDVVVRSR